MLVISLIVASLAVTRISMLFVNDQLMVGYRRWVIRRWGPDSQMSYLAHCTWCTSVWVAMPIMPLAALLPNVWVIAALAIPAASLIAGLLSNVRE